MSKDLYDSNWDKGFSFRNGIKEIKREKQKESLNKKTRIRILNLFHRYLEESPTEEFVPKEYGFDFQKKFIMYFVEKFYIIESYKYANTTFFPDIARSTLTESPWHDVFDFIEFWIYINLELLKEHKRLIDDFNYNKSSNIDYPNFFKFKNLSKMLNNIFEEEFVSYRVIGKHIAPIEDDVEIYSIKKTLDIPHKEVSRHIEKAIKHISDRESPDYANSIKESISSVEAMAKLITRKENITLGAALNYLKKQGVYIHQALEKAFKALYGYTSDSSGIRHGLTIGDKEPTFADAKFMLVACSAFNNYLLDNSKI